MAVKTIGTGSGIGTPDYSSVAAWVASLPATLTENETGNVLWASSANELVSTSAISLTGITAGSFTITLQATGSNSFTNSASNVLRYNASQGAGLRNETSGYLLYIDNVSNFYVEGLQLYGNAAYYHTIHTNSGSFYAQKSIIVNASSYRAVSMPTAGSNGYIKNTAILSNGPGVVCRGISIQNTTLFATGGSGTGIVGEYGNPICTNVMVLGFATATSSIDASSDYNCCTNASFGGSGTHNQTSATASTEIVSTTGGSEDLRLASGSVKAKDNGTSSGVPTTDVFGQSRSGNTDIGAFELQAGGGTPPIPPQILIFG